MKMVVVLSPCQDVVQVLHHLRDVSSSGLSPCSRGRRLLQFLVTVAAESDIAKSNLDVESTRPSRSPIVCLPRRVAVAQQSSADDQSTPDDNDADGSPWEIRLEPTVNKEPNRYSASEMHDGIPLLSDWTGKTADVESSRRDITRLDEAELAELIERSVSLDVPLQQSPHRLLAS